MLIILNRCLFCADMHVQKYKAKYCLKKIVKSILRFKLKYLIISSPSTVEVLFSRKIFFRDLNHIESLSKKLLKFEKKGLISYGKYLDNQLIYASKKDIRKQYKKYIKDQIKLNNKKLGKLDEKLK